MRKPPSATTQVAACILLGVILAGALYLAAQRRVAECNDQGGTWDVVGYQPVWRTYGNASYLDQDPVYGCAYPDATRGQHQTALKSFAGYPSSGYPVTAPR